MPLEIDLLLLGFDGEGAYHFTADVVSCAASKLQMRAMLSLGGQCELKTHARTSTPLLQR